MSGIRTMRTTKIIRAGVPGLFVHLLLLLTSLTFSASALADPQVITPSAGSTLSGSAQTFTWNTDNVDVERFWLYVGTTVGGRDIANSGDLGTGTDYRVIGIPVDGSTIHARLWYYSASRWFYVDSQYTAADLDVEVSAPAMLSPANNSELTGPTTEFTWSNNNTPVNYWWLYIGTTQGSNDLYNSGSALRTSSSVVVDGLPIDGSPVHARIWFRTAADGWKYTDSMYRTSDGGGGDFRDIPLVSNITGVQPMTGIVLWSSSHNNSPLKTSDEFVQLEYAYLDPSKTVIGEGNYDWSSLEATLEAVRGRGKQMVLRFAYVFPGQTTKVPGYIKSLPDYNETSGITEGRQTYFPDWSNATLQKAHIDLYTAFAERYDNDPRIAFLQVGFGLWSEYHIYQPGVQLGVNFPSKAYQTQFLNHMDSVFDTLQWSVSIDAGSQSVSAFQSGSSLMNLDFGVFDDSFMHENHGAYNQDMWNHFSYPQRYKKSVLGGEFSYYTSFDQQNVLNPEGIHGRTFADQSAKFHISYMIGNDQPDYQSNARIKQAGLSTGYRFRITAFQASSNESKVSVENIGVAPIYYDAFVTVNNVAATTSLKGLLPGTSADFTISAGGSNPVLSIEADRLVDGQRIEFEADL
ncbi:MAG: DUF4832 domain-containing protein [Granulosicoccus sp.]|nr:DUF4832 domain-containing protein [Granulosicoccus sp.]